MERGTFPGPLVLAFAVGLLAACPTAGYAAALDRPLQAEQRH